MRGLLGRTKRDGEKQTEFVVAVELRVREVRGVAARVRVELERSGQREVGRLGHQTKHARRRPAGAARLRRVAVGGRSHARGIDDGNGGQRAVLEARVDLVLGEAPPPRHGHELVQRRAGPGASVRRVRARERRLQVRPVHEQVALLNRSASVGD